MPEPYLPPTPVPSTDIHGKESLPCEAPLALPPPALKAGDDSCSSNASYCPVKHSRKRARTATESSYTTVKRLDFNLPPPPTRSRRIIQMKPDMSQDHRSAASKNYEKKRPETPSKPALKTAAGKKLARKTAHSVIERRRRSKMNEEFATLKDMIPACRGQGMHKLALLQAGIDYMRYLERCIEDLKTANRSADMPPRSQAPKLRARSSSPATAASDSGLDEREADDTQMVETDDESALLTSPILHAQSRPSSMVYDSTTTSPALWSERRSAASIAASPSSLPSPAIRPSSRCYPDFYNLQQPLSHSVGTSPAIRPQLERADHEAMTTLLMLNTDPRHTKNGRQGGLSVQELITT